MKFDWDPQKALSNEAKHRVAFEEAITAFDDPFGLVAPDPAHSTPRERRRWLIGQADNAVLVVVFTIRQPENVYRLISARRANRKERTRYEEAKGLSV